MEDWIGYAILFAGFCVVPAVILGIILLVIRGGKKATATQFAAPTTRTTVTSPQAGRQPAASPRTVSPTPTISASASLGEYTPIYLNFSNKPRAILDNMQTLNAQSEKVNTTRTRWSKGPRLMFQVGLGLILLEILFYALGYTPSCAFVTGGVVLWVIAIFLNVKLKRAQVKAFPPRFKEFEQIVHTLRDDLRPDTNLLGNLDLTGAKQTSKVARSAKDSQNRTTQYFRDQWLNFKAKMYDGNILRVSAIQRVKERQSYTKRSRISGKMKLKPAKFKGSYQELKVRIAVNDELYKIVRNSEIKMDGKIGEYTINAVDTEGGIVTVLATSPNENVSAQSVLGVLKFAYGLLKLKKA